MSAFKHDTRFCYTGWKCANFMTTPPPPYRWNSAALHKVRNFFELIVQNSKNPHVKLHKKEKPSPISHPGLSAVSTMNKAAPTVARTSPTWKVNEHAGEFALFVDPTSTYLRPTKMRYGMTKGKAMDDQLRIPSQPADETSWTSYWTLSLSSKSLSSLHGNVIRIPSKNFTDTTRQRCWKIKSPTPKKKTTTSCNWDFLIQTSLFALCQCAAKTDSDIQEER